MSDMIAKIKKLMALSQGEGNEAETAAKMATKLMTKHAIEMADLEEHEKTVVDPMVKSRIKVGRSGWAMELAWDLGRHCRISVLRSKRWDGVFATAFGPESDIEVWKYLYTIAAREIAKLTKAYGNEHTYYCYKREKDVVDRKATGMFRMGCVEGLDAKLRRQRTEATAVNTESTALILQDRKKAAETYMRSTGVRLGGGWCSGVSGSGAGYRAGQRINLNKGVGTSSTPRQIGGE